MVKLNKQGPICTAVPRAFTGIDLFKFQVKTILVIFFSDNQSLSGPRKISFIFFLSRMWNLGFLYNTTIGYYTRLQGKEIKEAKKNPVL